MGGNFINALAENTSDVLIVAAVLATVVGLALFMRARARHVRRLRAEVLGEVPITGGMREIIARAFNVTSAELATVGAVTFADLAWQYSLAAPSIWDHFHGPAANHIADAIHNLEVLRDALGAQASQVFAQVVESLKHIEATQVFHELAERLPILESAGTSSALALSAASHSAVDTLAGAGAVLESKAGVAASAASTIGDGGLLYHIPLITMGFATYRAWKRGQQGTALLRNMEFAAIEVTSRAGGALIGGQMGGVIGTAIAPGIGTIVGGVAGAIAGTFAGMKVGEDLKQRHVRQARRAFDQALSRLGQAYLEDPARYQQLVDVFVQHERAYQQSLRETRRRLHRHATPWRVAWPDQKLILLQETVRLAEDRLGAVRQGTIEALDRLDFMRLRGQNHELGVVVWSNPALREQLAPDPALVESLQAAHDRLTYEVAQFGAAWQQASAPS